MTTGQAHAVDDMKRALTEVGDALACGALDRLLAAEPVLCAALDRLARAGTCALDEEDRTAVEEARAALLRCRRLGAALTEFTRISLDPSNGQGYSRVGRVPAIESSSSAATLAPGTMLEARG